MANPNERRPVEVGTDEAAAAVHAAAKAAGLGLPDAERSDPEPQSPTESDGASTQAPDGEAAESPQRRGIRSLLGRVFTRDRQAAEGEESPGPGDNPPVVEFRGVTKRFGTFTAIRDVSFVVENTPDKGEFIAVLGPSGCGKSTILRLIAGLRPQYPPTEGAVLVGGLPVRAPGADRGFVFQDYASFPHRSVLHNVAFGLECQGVPQSEREDLAREWIAKVGLDVNRDQHKYPHQLSGGMRQRVAIARTLIMRPRIILMDEPFGALDPSTRLRMQDMLVNLWREAQATVFFITHSIEEAVYLGDRVYMMSPSPGTIVTQERVPPPDFPAREMQRHPDFIEIVANLRDRIEVMEESIRAGT